jgi:hypothetical protein
MNIGRTSAALALAFIGAVMIVVVSDVAIARQIIDDRAPHLYPKELPGMLGCVDDAQGRVTWGCD